MKIYKRTDCYRIVTFLFLLSSCQNLKETQVDIIIDQTFGSVLDIVVNELDIKSKKPVFVHQEIHSKAKDLSVETALNSKEFKPYTSLLEQLKISINDPVIFKADDYTYKNIKIFEYQSENPHHRDQGFSGTINLSNSVSNGVLGCYYFALNCGNHCSKGFFVIAELQDGRWKIKEFIQIWSG
jgi:hypothetical protein